MKRKLAIVSLFSAAISLGHLSFASWLAGFITAKFLSGKAEGKPGRIKSIIIPFRKYKLHLHHWFICSCVSIFGVIKGIYFLSPEIYFGFLGGLIFQGIYCYNDWYRIIKPRKDH